MLFTTTGARLASNLFWIPGEFPSTLELAASLGLRA
jgi:hypothetical protein